MALRGKKKTKVQKKKSFKKAFVSRSQACRALQIPLRDFRRLCILKGIFPREPRSFEFSSGKGKQYFFKKDIQWLQHEPVLHKLRDFKTWEKKLTHSLGRKDFVSARELQLFKKPTISLDHIIKERYPTFASALKDLDDALSHIFLYAILPPQIKATSTIEGHGFLSTTMSKKCRELTKRWMAYVGRSHSLRKTFISVKGFYSQADIQGESILWLTPFEFTTRMPKDVDYYAMIAFLEFYTSLLEFVLFKLERTLKQKKQKEEDEEFDKEVGGVKQDAKREVPITESLFSKCVFWLDNTCPKTQLTMIIQSFGGTIVRNEESDLITHYVTDRANVKHAKVTAEYVQPQWIFDSVNQQKLLHVDPYRPGKALPPHLSPWDSLEHREIGEKILQAKQEQKEKEEYESSHEDEFEAKEIENEGVVTSDEEGEPAEKDGEEANSDEEKMKQSRDYKRWQKAVPRKRPAEQAPAPKRRKTVEEKKAIEDKNLEKMKLELVSGKKRKQYTFVKRAEKRQEKSKLKLAHRYLHQKKAGNIE